MRYILLFVLFFCITQTSLGYALQDSTQKTDTVIKIKYRVLTALDSANLARKAFVRDSITWYFLNPDPKRANPYVEKLLRDNVTTDPYLLSLPKNYKKVTNSYGLGVFINKYPKWFLMVAIVLLCLFAIVKVAFSKEISVIFKAFFDDRTLSQIGKEDNILITWQFVFLYLIFSFTVGLFICLLMYKTKASNLATDFTSFLVISLFSFIFFGIKILSLRLIGFLFEIQKITKEYLNVIYITYVNSLFILLPIIFVLSLVSINQGNVIVWTFLAVFSGLIGFQFVRIAIKILLNHQLSKFYLFLYLCTFEICPIILFAKTINISL
ncbi:DUF4271 domain-containing protein [Pedobacter alpinus]|uniref:DUF4271 domain-containing protein n=1 Tax=Pedobacter alpinus TaxID=1590643 RepID=A0ABW5TNR0_9SPHI